MQAANRLVRLSQFGGATIGCLIIDHVPICYTLEPPWKGNKREQSRIPTGRYTAKIRRNYPLRNGMIVPVTYEITGVPDRSGICIHVGNELKHTLGCPLPGMRVDANPTAVRDSRIAFQEFLKATNEKEEFKITVIDAC